MLGACLLRQKRIAIDNLRFIREHLAAGRIHGHLQPVHISEGGLVVTEGLDAREVHDPLSGDVQQRLVHAEVVRIAVDVGDWFSERNHLAAQSPQKIPEAISRPLCIVLDEGLGIASRGAGTVGIIPCQGRPLITLTGGHSARITLFAFARRH